MADAAPFLSSRVRDALVVVVVVLVATLVIGSILDDRVAAVLASSTLSFDEQSAVRTTVRLALTLTSATALAGGLALAFAWARRTARLLDDIARTGRASAPRSTTADAIDGEDTSADAVHGVLKSLASERDALAALFDGMDDAVLALDDDDRVRIANRAASDLFARRDLVGRALRDLLPLDDVAALSAADGTVATEIHVGTPRRTLGARRSPTPSSTGSILVLQDRSEQQRVEAVRRDFVANVSHELRTPIGIIRANVEALESGALDEPADARRFLSALSRNAARLAQLVEDLLDLARIESGSYRPAIVPVRIADVVGQVADTMASTIEESRHEIALELEEHVTALGDANALEHILTNYLENAIKYTPAPGHLWIRARVDGPKTVRVEVADDGPGVDGAHRARLFERFYRVDPGRSKQRGGTGLGLAIVKHLAFAMDGDVGMEPNVPRGARFFVILPRA